MTEAMRLVPEAALKWLFGEGPDEAGYWFGDYEDGTSALNENRPAFWWRRKFHKMLAAAPPALHADDVGEIGKAITAALNHPDIFSTEEWNCILPWLERAHTLLQQNARLAAALADYEASYEQHQRNVRRLDVALNGDDAAQGPLLIDVLGQVEDLVRRNGKPVLAALAEAERDAECIRALHTSETECHAKTIDALAEERATFKKYACHLIGCSIHRGAHIGCNCGLVRALEPSR